MDSLFQSLMSESGGVSCPSTPVVTPMPRAKKEKSQELLVEVDTDNDFAMLEAELLTFSTAAVLNAQERAKIACADEDEFEDPCQSKLMKALGKMIQVAPPCQL